MINTLVGVIYASLDVITATHEAYQNFVAFGFPMTAIQPRVTAGAQVSLSKVLDLTDSEVQDAIGFSLNDMINEEWKAIHSGGEEAWTQAIGRGCYSAGFEGMIVPSAQHAGRKNIVIFPKSLAKTAQSRCWQPTNCPNDSSHYGRILHNCRYLCLLFCVPADRVDKEDLPK